MRLNFRVSSHLGFWKFLNLLVRYRLDTEELNDSPSLFISLGETASVGKPWPCLFMFTCRVILNQFPLWNRNWRASWRTEPGRLSEAKRSLFLLSILTFTFSVRNENIFWHCEIQLRTAVNVKVSVFVDMTQCRLVARCHCFGGNCCRHIQGGRINIWRKGRKQTRGVGCFLKI